MWCTCTHLKTSTSLIFAYMTDCKYMYIHLFYGHAWVIPMEQQQVEVSRSFQPPQRAGQVLCERTSVEPWSLVACRVAGFPYEVHVLAAEVRVIVLLSGRRRRRGSALIAITTATAACTAATKISTMIVVMVVLLVAAIRGDKSGVLALLCCFRQFSVQPFPHRTFSRTS